MKLVRWGKAGSEKPGLIDAEGKLRDLSKVVKDINPETLSPAGLAKIKAAKVEKLPLVKGKQRMGVPLKGCGKFIAIGLNYSDHAAETGNAIPKEPIVFHKTTSSMGGATDNVVLVKDSVKTDWEIELGIVIGRKALNVTKEKALSYVAGYVLVNDVSERMWQAERGGTWDKGKGADTYGPIGPWIATRDEVKNPQNLEMWLDVNGEKRQRGNTKTMIFDCATLVSYCSQFFTLHPGDVITTGTPPGVALGMKPEPKFLRAGDIITLGITGLGEQRTKVVSWKK